MELKWVYSETCCSELVGWVSAWDSRFFVLYKESMFWSRWGRFEYFRLTSLYSTDITFCFITAPSFQPEQSGLYTVSDVFLSYRCLVSGLQWNIDLSFPESIVLSQDPRRKRWIKVSLYTTFPSLNPLTQPHVSPFCPLHELQTSCIHWPIFVELNMNVMPPSQRPHSFRRANLCRTNINYITLGTWKTSFSQSLGYSKSLAAFYGTRRFITVFTKPSSIPYLAPDESNPYHPISLRSDV
jgi:hypothetical protein